MSKMITVEVVYALPDRQILLSVQVQAGSDLASAIAHSGLLVELPGMDLSQQAVGIFGKRKKLSDQVRQGDRIEIYRPLRISPMEARRAKAKKRRFR